MILVEYGIHLTGKANGSHGHWATKQKVTNRERNTIRELLDGQMRRLTTPGQPFELRRVTYAGKWRGIKVEKTKMVRQLAPEWQQRLDGGLEVTLTRYAEKGLDDDNLRRGFKAIRDGVADAFGIGDADPRIRFAYSDERAVPSRVSVRVEWPN